VNGLSGVHAGPEIVLGLHLQVETDLSVPSSINEIGPRKRPMVSDIPSCSIRRRRIEGALQNVGLLCPLPVHLETYRSTAMGRWTRV
jgi:hypothetical protein